MSYELPKSLNTPFPILQGMGDASYSGTAYSAYDRSRLLNKGISAISGLAALVGVTYSTAAQDVQPISYRDTNLASYGVPSVDGLKPYRSRTFDLTDRLPGNETQLDVFKTNDAMIGIFSVNGKMFQIGYDRDFKAPTDRTYRDANGDGVFEPYNSQAKVVVPEWALR